MRLVQDYASPAHLNVSKAYVAQCYQRKGLIRIYGNLQGLLMDILWTVVHELNLVQDRYARPSFLSLDSCLGLGNHAGRIRRRLVLGAQHATALCIWPLHRT